ncbi:CBM35 domain-containing protein, partial [Methylobacterium gregans]|uniref:CBM35 domain-containing protein n=1 Tax=Methylobacterium gregans TaxID=374424 RepID=UPI0024B49433
MLVPAATGTVPNDGETVVNGVTYLRYEAEKAALGGAPAVVTENRNQSGAFVDFVGPDTETITWTVEVGTAGTYGVDILYALGVGKTARPMTLAVNGEARETLPFTANSSAAEDVWGPQTATLQLKAGVNTIALTAPGGIAPNLDYLRVTKAPISVFTPDYADIVGSGRIELETQNGSAHVVNGSAVEFFFTVSADGVYKIDTAANANAANGQGLTWLLNGVAVDESAFPGVGTAGETSVYLELKAGTEYRLRIVSDAPGASALDYLDIGRAPGNPNADIAVQSLDPAFFDNRLHFSFLEDPDFVAPDAADRDFKASGTVRITNTGTEALTLTDHELSGPFLLANPAQLDGLSIAPGASVNVTVNFNRAAYTPPTTNVDATSTVFQGALKLITNDADDPVTTIDLAGFWQARDEGG